MCSWQQRYGITISAVWCIAFLMSDWFLLLTQFLFVPNRINKFVYFRMHWPISCLNQILLEFGQYLVIYILSGFQQLPQPKHTSVPALCISVWLKSLTQNTFSNWKKWFFHLFKKFRNLHANCHSDPLLSQFKAGNPPLIH